MNLKSRYKFININLAWSYKKFDSEMILKSQTRCERNGSVVSGKFTVKLKKRYHELQGSTEPK